MANTANFSATLSALINGAQINLSGSGSITVSGVQLLQDTQNIGTSAEALTFGEISSAPAKVFLKNLDTTNYIEIAGDSGITQFVQKLSPGDTILLSPESATMYAKANTAACNLWKGAVSA